MKSKKKSKTEVAQKMDLAPPPQITAHAENSAQASIIRYRNEFIHHCQQDRDHLKLEISEQLRKTPGLLLYDTHGSYYTTTGIWKNIRQYIKKEKIKYESYVNNIKPDTMVQLVVDGDDFDYGYWLNSFSLDYRYSESPNCETGSFRDLMSNASCSLDNTSLQNTYTEYLQSISAAQKKLIHEVNKLLRTPGVCLSLHELHGLGGHCDDDYDNMHAITFIGTKDNIRSLTKLHGIEAQDLSCIEVSTPEEIVIVSYANNIYDDDCRSFRFSRLDIDYNMHSVLQNKLTVSYIINSRIETFMK